MAIVKSIDVALRANTEQFDAGLKSGTKSLDSFSNNAERVASRMGKVAEMFQLGVIGPQEYSKAIRECELELDAMSHGFGSLNAATQRAQQILLGLETETDRYNNKLKELDALLKLDRLTQEQHAAAVQKTTAAYLELQSKMAGPSQKDKSAQAVGFSSMADAVSRADSVLSGMQTRTEQYRSSIKELNQLVSIGALDQDQYAEALKRTKEVFATLFQKTTAADLKAQSAGFANMSDAMSRADSVISGLKTKTELYSDKIKELHRLFKAGAVTPEQFTAALRKMKAEFASTFIKPTVADLRAQEHGFSSMSSAMSEATAVLKSLETETERYNAKLSHLNRLMKVGALTPVQHANAVERTTAAYKSTLGPVSKAADGVDRLGVEYAGSLPIIGQFSYLMDGIGTPIGAAVVAFAGAAAAMKTFQVAFSKVAEMVRSGLDRLDEAADASERLGLLTAEFQKLQFAAEFSDASTESLTRGLEKMSRNISDAVSGSESASRAFRQLGLDARVLSGMSTNEAFRAIAEAVSRVESPFDQMRLAMEIFGRRGAELIIMLRGGAEALDAFAAKADRFRIPTNEQDIRNIKDAHDSIKELTKSYEGLQNALARRAAPILSQVAKDATEAVEAPSSVATTSNIAAIGAEVQRSSNIFLAAYRVSRLYFDHVQEASNLSANAISGMNQPLESAASHFRNAFSPDEIERFSEVLLEASKRQQEITAKAREMQASLGAERASVSISTPTVSIPNVPPLQIGVNVDPQPLQTFETAVASLQQRLTSGVIDKSQFVSLFAELQKQLDMSQSRLQEFYSQQAALAQKAIERERQLAATRQQTLQRWLDSQTTAWSAANPALAAQEELRRKVAEINDLYKAGLVTLAKRNELLAFAASQVKTPAMEEAEKAQADMKSRGDELKKSMQSPFEKFTDTVAELQKLRNGDFIDPETFSRAFAHARDTFSQSLQQPSEVPQFVKGPAALDAGSQQAFSAFQQAKRDTSKADAQVEEQKLTNKKLDTLTRRAVVLAAARL